MIDISYEYDYTICKIKKGCYTMIQIEDISHAWVEVAGFELERKWGYPSYTFLHFFHPVDILINGKMVHTHPHACILYNIDTPQKFYSKSQLLHDWIHFEGDMDEHFTKFGLEYDTIYYPSNAEFITQITMELEHDFLSNKANKTDFINAKIDELFIKLHRSCNNDDSFVAETTTQAVFRDLRSTVFSTLKEPWTVERMAKQVNLSPSRFHSMYKKIFGKSPVDDLIHARIQNAQNALLYSNSSISEIARELGYNNLSHFIRQFKAICGISPSQYRERPNTDPAALHIQQNDYQSELRREFRINHKDYIEVRRVR